MPGLPRFHVAHYPCPIRLKEKQNGSHLQMRLRPLCLFGMIEAAPAMNRERDAMILALSIAWTALAVGTFLLVFFVL